MESPFKHDSFLFSSVFHSLYTEGIFKTITQSATSPAELCRILTHEFEQARLAGITQPIVVGAIPFDTRQPSSLYIPRASHFLSREAFRQKLLKIQRTPLLITERQPLPDKDHFLAMVEKAVKKIRQGTLQKIVLSRTQSIRTEHPIETIALLSTLAEQNPDGYHFRLPLTENRYLFGASPELLLRQEKRTIATTPLAGTIKRDADAQQDRDNCDRLLASDKDRHEHRLVIEDIRQRLSGYCAKLDIPQTPTLLPTPQVWHLASPITGQLKADNVHPLFLACLLHPTPALCGLPMEKARSLISELEPFERGVFGGIVGWSDAEGNGEWVVAIRCGVSQHNAVRLYAGAGIVADSEPAAEWRETEAKMRTMLAALDQ
ncbi:isochorismate synthase [Brenneria izadpanahii]|uniref:isochorismate synthase n=1 Tax=Brenneria izadpanahii TaxID=2722756 RepID=A0ABX7UZX3_9GAMM|nr:isochorismate synthase [Brenneria izadpanahii]QTF10157.1 isochorismate synthase [Brenneria izadpanahii]